MQKVPSREASSVYTNDVAYTTHPSCPGHPSYADVEINDDVDERHKDLRRNKYDDYAS